MNSKYLIALNRHPKIGSQTLKKILAIYGDPSVIWHEKDSDLIASLGEKIAGTVIEAKVNYDPDQEITRLGEYGVGYITIFDKNYPKALKEIYDCPTILYVKGDVDILNHFSLGVVGSRKYTAYGKNQAYRLSRECAEAGLVIVSGLALGIDAFAHQAALDAHEKTVGVLGCGLDTIYPVSNFHLARTIIESGGAIISEFPLGVRPMKHNFPARNRIIAGLSSGLLVIEAAEKSGALITAYQALDYSREVFALPGNIDSASSLGTNRLIQEGAKLVLNTDDILKELNVEVKKREKKVRKIMPESEEEKIVIEILKSGDALVDEIIIKSQLNVVIINSTLTILEMVGKITNLGGGRYHLNNS